MSFRSIVWAPLAAAACALTWVTTLAPAQATSLPPAESLVAGHRRAVNADVFLRAKSIRSRGTLQVPAVGVSAPLILEQVAPNRMRMTTSLPGAGEILQGFDGTTAWAVDPMQGPRLLTGSQLAQVRDDADFRSSMRPSELVREMRTVERTTIGGAECWLVRVSWRSGRETHDCYDVGTGLLVAARSTVQSPMGEAEVTTRYSDYREFAGMRFPARSVIETMGQQQVIVLESVELDVVKDDLRDLPPAIRTLLGTAPRRLP